MIREDQKSCNHLHLHLLCLTHGYAPKDKKWPISPNTVSIPDISSAAPISRGGTWQSTNESAASDPNQMVQGVLDQWFDVGCRNTSTGIQLRAILQINSHTPEDIPLYCYTSISNTALLAGTPRS